MRRTNSAGAFDSRQGARPSSGRPGSGRDSSSGTGHRRSGSDYTEQELKQSAAGKEDFFAAQMQRNANKCAPPPLFLPRGRGYTPLDA